ncbi:MAG: PASTA domain-containing protein [Streptosporangiaceae bacterium]
MDTTLSPPTGQLLDGRYLIEAQLARGGMATVYLGRDIRLDRPVAVKIAHPELASDHEFITRFISEARSAARLSSPHVVAIYDQGSDGDMHYIAMEYVPGQTLRELLNSRGRLSPRESLDIIEGVLAGLAAAHEAGIIHRDVKPENVLLSRGNVVKVADFGLARAMAGVSHTKTGMIIGTAAYLAPEQVSSSTSDARTDVYAAGVMLFELLTGTQPHTGETPLAVAHKHVNDVVPAPSSVVPGLPPALDALVALATSRDPDLRPADASHFLLAIHEVRGGMPLPAGVRGRGQHAAPAGENPADASPGDADPGAARGAGRGAAHAATGSAADGTLAGAAAASAGSPASRRPPAGPAGRTALTDRLLGAPAVPPADTYQAMNHTIVVPAGGIDIDDPDEPAGYRRRSRRADRGPREPRLQRWLFSRRLAYLAAALAVVLVIGLSGWWYAAGRYTTTPDVAGMSVSLARTELSNLGLAVRTGARLHSNVPKGEIIRSDPAAGARVRHGGTVTLVTSLGPVQITVPQVTGMPVAQAEQTLKAAGLTPGTPLGAVSPSVPAGEVISTNPVAGTLWPKNKPVQITVSSGPPLPSFVGQQVSAAQATAQQGGYQITWVQDARSSQPSGTITRQSPAAGTPVAAGEVVTVWVSPGPPLVTVPNVIGMGAQQAAQVLQQAGFQVTENKQGLGNRVYSISPSGPRLPAGSAITINVGFTLF